MTWREEGGVTSQEMTSLGKGDDTVACDVGEEKDGR